MPEIDSCPSCVFCENMVCKRYPPQQYLYPTDNQHPIMYDVARTQPIVGVKDWCGEYKRRQ